MPAQHTFLKNLAKLTPFFASKIIEKKAIIIAYCKYFIDIL